MIDFSKLPNWTKSFLENLPITQQYIFYENIYDFYPFYNNKLGFLTQSLPNYFSEILYERGYQNIVFFEPLSGFKLSKGNVNTLRNLGFSFDESNFMESVLLKNSYVIIKNFLEDSSSHNALIFNFSSHMKELPIYKNDVNDFLFTLFKFSLESFPKKINDKTFYNLVIFIAERREDFPFWYQNPKIKYINISKPDIEARKHIITNAIENISDFYEISSVKKTQIIEFLAKVTSDMQGKEILNIFMLAKNLKIKTKDMGNFIKKYKINLFDDYWKRRDVDLPDNLEDIFAKYCYIEKKSVKLLSNIICSAFYNLNDIALNKYENIRAFMLFAGCNYEEKIKTAKLLCKTIFKNEDAYIEVDLLNINKKELFKHLKHFPQSVIVFKGLEESSVSILNEIWKILEDGKLEFVFEDKKEIVYFYESILIFTFNNKDESENFEMFEKQTFTLLNQFFEKNGFKYLYNKIKNKIIVFDPFDKTRVAKYSNKLISFTLENIKTNYQITVVIEENVRKKIIDEIINNSKNFETSDIESACERVLAFPLSKLLCKLSVKNGDVLMITDFVYNKDFYEFKGILQ